MGGDGDGHVRYGAGARGDSGIVATEEATDVTELMAAELVVSVREAAAKTVLQVAMQAPELASAQKLASAPKPLHALNQAQTPPFGTIQVAAMPWTTRPVP